MGDAAFDLSFSVEHRFRPFALVAPAFVAVTAERAEPRLILAESGPVAPYAAVEMRVSVPPGGGGQVVAGLSAPGDGDQVLVVYDAARGRVAIEVRVDGRRLQVRRKSVRLPGEFRLAFVLCENRVTALVADADTGDGHDAWRPVLSERGRVAEALDLRDPATLEPLAYAWGSRWPTRGPDPGDPAVAPVVSAVRAGLFGMVGLRDLHLVQHADGRPYTRAGRTYLTATCAGTGFFQQAHWGVFSFDAADPVDLRQEAQLFSTRDGFVLGDHAGQVVRTPDDRGWIVATSSWGDFEPGSIHVRHAVTSDDVLHGVHVLETEPTPMPTTLGAWDPGLTLIDGRWHVSFVESSSQHPFRFWPRLAVGPPGADWTEGLEAVGERPRMRHCEGPILTRVDGTWWFLASDGGRRCYPVFTTGMERVGRVDAPYLTNIPHPQVVPMADGSHLILTFDGTRFGDKVLGYGGHGDVVVMRSPSPG